jgi:UDP-glucose 4-epimerase
LALSSGHTVLAIDRAATTEPPDRPGLEERRADLTDFGQFNAAVADADALVHLAAYITPEAGADHVVHNNNVVASYNALSVAAAHGIDRVCLASSVNAIGGYYSREPRYDYFPLDEHHRCYAEDPYSLSKWIAEQQAAAFGRRYERMSIASLRLHALRDRAYMAALVVGRPEAGHKDLWGYTPVDSAAQACLAAVTADFNGFETFYVVASDTTSEITSMQLRNRFYPDVPVKRELDGHGSFFDTSKAEKLLNWSAP